MSPIETRAHVIEWWKTIPIKDKIYMVLIYCMVVFSVYTNHWQK